MESVSLVLIASLLLHFIFKPYNVDLWNATESLASTEVHVGSGKHSWYVGGCALGTSGLIQCCSEYGCSWDACGMYGTQLGPVIDNHYRWDNTQLNMGSQWLLTPLLSGMQIQVLYASRIHSALATRSNLGSCAKQAHSYERFMAGHARNSWIEVLLSTYLGTKPPRNLPAQLRIGLLTLALVLTGLTTTVLANDLHWAHSFVTGRVTIVLVIMLVAMICGTMAILVTQIRWVAIFLLCLVAFIRFGDLGLEFPETFLRTSILGSR